MTAEDQAWVWLAAIFCSTWVLLRFIAALHARWSRPGSEPFSRAIQGPRREPEVRE